MKSLLDMPVSLLLLDVLVVAGEDAHRRKTAQAIYRRLLGSGLAVDVIVAKPSDLEKYGQSAGLVYREALRDGRELYVKVGMKLGG